MLFPYPLLCISISSNSDVPPFSLSYPSLPGRLHRRPCSPKFYVFPCGHAFHSECLLDHIRPHLSADQQAAVTSLLAMITAGEGGGSGTVPSSSLGLTGAAATAAAAAGGRGLAAVGGGTNKESVASASKRTQHYLRALQVSTVLAVMPFYKMILAVSTKPPESPY